MAARAPAPRRGEVWWAELPGDKSRPVLVLTRDPMGAHLNSVVVAPVTTTIRGIASELRLGPEDGLPRVCAANFDYATSIRRAWLRRRMAKLSDERMGVACAALAFALACR